MISTKILCLVYFLFLAAGQVTKTPNCGTQTVSIFNGNGISFQRSPYAPDELMLYYNDFLIERILKVKHRAGVNYDRFSYDTLYILINFKTKDCREYRHFAKGEVAGRAYKLNEKALGIQFNTDIDSTVDYAPSKQLRDTVADGKRYRYVSFSSKSEPQRYLTCYFSPGSYPVLYHISNRMDKDYKATLLRMDVTDKQTKAGLSIRMNVHPHLTPEQLAVFKSWLLANRWQ